MTDMLDFGPQTRLVARIAGGVADDQLAAPTPCPAYEVHNLLGHLVGLTAAFRDAARKDFGPSTNTDPGSALPDIGGGWRGALGTQLEELAEAWRDPAAWEGDTQAGGVHLSGAEAGLVAMNELVVHGWDLARATGQPYAPDTASLEVAYELMAPVTDEAARAGAFGPVVDVPADAPLLDRVVGVSGRDPGWTPGS